MVVPRESWSCDMKANAILKRIPLQKREMTLLFIRPCCLGSTYDYSTMCMYFILFACVSASILLTIYKTCVLSFILLYFT